MKTYTLRQALYFLRISKKLEKVEKWTRRISRFLPEWGRKYYPPYTLRQALHFLRISKEPEKIEKWRKEVAEFFPEWRRKYYPPPPKYRLYIGRVWWQYTERKKRRTTHIEVSFRWTKPIDWVENLEELKREIIEEALVQASLDPDIAYLTWLAVEKPRIGVERIEPVHEEEKEIEFERIERFKA